MHPLENRRALFLCLGGVFVVLLCGLAFAVLIAIFEFCYNSRRNAPAERVSASTPETNAEIHFNKSSAHSRCTIQFVDIAVRISDKSGRPRLILKSLFRFCFIFVNRLNYFKTINFGTYACDRMRKHCMTFSEFCFIATSWISSYQHELIVYWSMPLDCKYPKYSCKERSVSAIEKNLRIRLLHHKSALSKTLHK